MIGPKMGPTKEAAEKTAIATARSTGPQKSAKAPTIIARDEQPKNPTKNRISMMVSTFRATATGI